MNLSKFLIENIVLIIAAIVSGGMLAWPAITRRGGAASVNATEATRLANREKGVFVDVSEAGEFANAHITGSKNIPLAELKDRLKDLPSNKQTPVILVCASGARSGKAVSSLRAQGYERVVSLERGLAGWRAAGMPVEKV